MSEQNAVRNELSLAQENAALRSRVAVLEEELALIQEQFAWLKKQVFGRKTEQSSVIMDNGQHCRIFSMNCIISKQTSILSLLFSLFMLYLIPQN